MFEIWIHKGADVPYVGAWMHVWKANNYFSIIKIISNAQFFISNWLVRIYVFFKFHLCFLLLFNFTGEFFHSITSLYYGCVK